MFSSMALRLGKKLLFVVIAEFIFCNDIYKMIERNFILIFLITIQGDMMGMATTTTAQANATMPLSSSSLASLSAVETFFYFFERKEKEKINEKLW